jgi:hypothetical protein
MWVVHVCRPASMRKRDECGPRNVRAELFFPGWPRGRQRLTKPYQLPLIIIRSSGRKFLAGLHQSHPVGFMFMPRQNHAILAAGRHSRGGREIPTCGDSQAQLCWPT